MIIFMRANGLSQTASTCCDSDLSSLSDEVLVLQIRSANERQTMERLFGEIFLRYQAKVVGWCYALTRNRDTAADLSQEVFLKVFRSLPAFRGDSRISTWIYVITRNHCINSLRRLGVEPVDAAAEIPTNLQGATGREAHDALEQAQKFGNVYRFISSFLTPLEVRVLLLHYAEDQTLEAITRKLLLENRSGAKAYIVSAKRKLKLYLNNRGMENALLAGGSLGRAGKPLTMEAPLQEMNAFAA